MSSKILNFDVNLQYASGNKCTTLAGNVMKHGSSSGYNAKNRTTYSLRKHVTAFTLVNGRQCIRWRSLATKNKTGTFLYFHPKHFCEMLLPNEHCNQNSTVFTSSHLHHVDCLSLPLLIIQEIQLRQYILQL